MLGEEMLILWVGRSDVILGAKLMMCLESDDVVLREELMVFPKGMRHHSWREMMWLLGKRRWSFISSREGGIQWGPKRRVMRFGKPWPRKPIQQGRNVAKEEGWRGEVEKVQVVGKEQVARNSRWVMGYSGNVEGRGGFG